MPFEFTRTHLEGVIVIQPRKFSDDRGFFLESYKKSDFVSAGINVDFVQDNHSLSQRGVLRGIHFQSSPFAQGKLVRVVKGAVWDVAVDLIPESSTYGKFFGIELSEANGKMMYIPPGFGHGFLTLEEETHFMYKCTAEYNSSADGGIRWDDDYLGIAWPLDRLNMQPVVSSKDAELPLLKDIV